MTNNNTENTSPDLMVTRDLKVGRNVTAGGNTTVRGNLIVEHGLKVKGWLDAENMNFPTAGVFPMSDMSGGGDGMDNLRYEYPNPKNGMIAGVIDTSGNSPVVYLCYSNPDGTWTKTDETVPIKTLINYTTDDVELQQMLDELQKEIEEDISGKADVVQGATSGNFAALNSNGNLADSGKKPTDFALANHTHPDLESLSNKTLSLTNSSTNRQYPSAKAVYDWGGQFALKSEMGFTDGTGANADKTTVQLKSGTTKQVLIAHQDIRGKADKSEMTVKNLDGKSIITLKAGLAVVAYTPEMVDELLGRAVGEAVRCTFHFEAADAYKICSSKDLLLAVIDGVGIMPDQGNAIIKVDNPGDITASFVFRDASVIPQYAFQGTAVVAVHIPSFVRQIDSLAFGDCANLAKGNIDCEGITPPAYPSDAFGGADLSNATLTVHAVASTYYTDYQGSGNKWAGVGTINNY